VFVSPLLLEFSGISFETLDFFKIIWNMQSGIYELCMSGYLDPKIIQILSG